MSKQRDLIRVFKKAISHHVISHQHATTLYRDVMYVLEWDILPDYNYAASKDMDEEVRLEREYAANSLLPV